MTPFRGTAFIIWIATAAPAIVAVGGALHDTFSAPEIAENFLSTPEQLLGQLREIEIGSPPT